MLPGQKAACNAEHTSVEHRFEGWAQKVAFAPCIFSLLWLIGILQYIITSSMISEALMHYSRPISRLELYVWIDKLCTMIRWQSACYLWCSVLRWTGLHYGEPLWLWAFQKLSIPAFQAIVNIYTQILKALVDQAGKLALTSRAFYNGTLYARRALQTEQMLLLPLAYSV